MMRRRLLLVAALLLCAGCEDRHSWRANEADDVGWWLEDVAHGNLRRPGELQLVDASECQERVATWAAGSPTGEARTWPQLLQARLTRSPLIAAIAGEGLVVHTQEGLLAPRPGLRLDEREVVEPLVDAENRDRRQLDGLVLALADARAEPAAAYLQAVTRARCALDEAVGVKAWLGTTHPAHRASSP